ncbi:hypothetical protein AB1Y20_010157 [Prymnesium parvum]|uniref:Uncharacterized protein n=1 Tax=Prymnesium parvum TaxID=97485 RepID=A0AB34K442_PRYPA
MESLAEAASEAAVGAAPQTRGEPALDGGTECDSSCAIVGEKRVRSDAVTAMNNKNLGSSLYYENVNPAYSSFDIYRQSCLS